MPLWEQQNWHCEQTVKDMEKNLEMKKEMNNDLKGT